MRCDPPDPAPVTPTASEELVSEPPIVWYPCACGAEHSTPTCPFAALLETGGVPQEEETKDVMTRMDRLSTSSDASRTAATDVAEGERPTTPDQPRNEWRRDARGALDDVVVDAPECVRLERMSDDHIWGAVYHRDGSRTVFDIFGDRVSFDCEHEPAPSNTSDGGHQHQRGLRGDR